MCNPRITTIFLIILTFPISLAAQSGRVIEPPTPPLSPAKAEETAKVPSCEMGLDEMIYLYLRPADQFVEELNRLGKCGYRLEMAGDKGGSYLFGVVKKDSGNNKYEYQWFATGSAGEVVTRANAAAKDGFYFRRGMMFYSPGSEPSIDDDSILKKLGVANFPGNGSIFIFERKNGVIKRREYRMIIGANQTGKKALAANQVNLNEKVADGFHPVALYYMGLFDAHEILIEKDPDIKPEGDYLLLRYSYNISNLLTRQAAEGYRPLMTGVYFAILHRNNSDPIPVKYQSTDLFNTAFKKIAPLPGARYDMAGINTFMIDVALDESKPFFTLPMGTDLKRYEYQTVDLTNFNERYFTNKDKKASMFDVPPAYVLERFRTKIREGYALRDVVVNLNEITAVFEREVK